MTTPSDEIAFGRAFLERAFKVASDPDADANERAYAQAVVSAVKEKTAGVSLDFLLDVGSKTSSLDKIALKRSTVVSAGQKLGLIGGARAEKALARSALREERFGARAADDLKKGVVEYKVESPSYPRKTKEIAFQNAIHSGGREAARAKDASLRSEMLGRGVVGRLGLGADRETALALGHNYHRFLKKEPQYALDTVRDFTRSLKHPLTKREVAEHAKLHAPGYARAKAITDKIVAQADGDTPAQQLVERLNKYKALKADRD